MKHQRVVVQRRGGPDVLQVVEEDLPEPRRGEARVQILAAGVSALDLMIRARSFPGFPRVPFTPGLDIVGVVDKLGQGVSTVEPGQMIAGCPAFDGGGYAEFICRPASELVSVPSGLDSAEAVCLVANYLTAHLALHESASMRSGELILVHGAAGGVGTALLEIGKLAGLEMYGTASKHNHDLVFALGATPIDYRTEDFVERIRSLTGDGEDAVLDPIGGARQLWRSYRALSKGGRLVWFGVAATTKAGMRVIPLSLLTLFLLKLIPGGRRAPLFPDIGKYPQTHNAWYRESLTEPLERLPFAVSGPIATLMVVLRQFYQHSSCRRRMQEPNIRAH